jgi:hypothetical protein
VRACLCHVLLHPFDPGLLNGPLPGIIASFFVIHESLVLRVPRDRSLTVFFPTQGGKTARILPEVLIVLLFHDSFPDDTGVYLGMALDDIGVSLCSGNVKDFLIGLHKINLPQRVR